MAKYASFVEIVREMVEQGHNLPTIVETLAALGVSKADAGKLVALMLKKSVPEAQNQIDDLLRKKIISVEAASQIRLERRAMSSKRRQERKWNQIFGISDSLIREFAPAKHLAFKQRWRRLAAAREQEHETRKEMQALLLEIKQRKLPYRAETKLERAIEMLETD